MANAAVQITKQHHVNVLDKIRMQISRRTHTQADASMRILHSPRGARRGLTSSLAGQGGSGVAKASLGVKKRSVPIRVGLTSVLRGRDPWRRTCTCALASAGEGSPLRLLSNEALLRIRRGRGGRGLQVGSVWLDEPGPRARWDLRGVIHACEMPWAGPRGRGAVGRLRGSHLFAPPAE